jgi:superfamily II DNA or RNA helicase
MKINIERISNDEYFFGSSDRRGIKSIAKSLTFPNPNPISKKRYIEFFDKRKFTFKLGMITTVKKYLNENEIKYNLIDYSYEIPNIEIDDRLSGNYVHQRNAVLAFYKRRFGIIVVPTRGGKTFIASEICRIFLNIDEGNFLFCVDNTTLFTQAVNDFKQFFERYGGIEIGEIRSGVIDTSKRITVAMIQTMQRTLSNSCVDRAKKKKLRDFLKDLRFLCIDEIHDNCSDNKLKLYRRCSNLKYQLCLSATPYRSGAVMENLKLQAWSGDIVYNISEKTLRDRGVLSDYCVFELLVDHNEIEYNDLIEDDYADLRRRLIFNSDVRNRYIIHIVKLLQKLKLKSLLLFQSIEHGQLIAHAVDLPFICGRDNADVREKSKEELLNNKEGGILLASDIFKKGVTLPDVQVLLICDNNKETAITMQRKGRVLGATKDKTKSLVIDFIDVYDAYFSNHSESRLNTYVESVGEDKVGILDTSADDCFLVLEEWIKNWFELD